MGKFVSAEASIVRTTAKEQAASWPFDKTQIVYLMNKITQGWATARLRTPPGYFKIIIRFSQCP